MNFVNRGYARLATAKSSKVEMAIVDIEENLISIAFVESLVKPSRANESEYYASTEEDGRNPENILVSSQALHSVSITHRD